MDTSKLKGLWEKVKDFFKNMSKRLRIILAAALAVILVAVIVFSVLFSGGKAYTQLYQDLTPTEVSEIMTYFQNNGITDYQVTGTTLMVRSDQYNALVAQLAMAGYPKNASLYESYYEHVGALSTSSQEARTWQITVQEGLAACIRSFPDVLDAQVFINPGQQRTYVLEDVSTETTASVKVEMRSGTMLSEEAANGIRRLVSHAWSGMTVDSVEIVDGIGNTYSDTSGNAGTLIELKRRLEESQSNYVRTQIKHLLDDAFGADNVKVAATATVDVSERVVESTTYHQPEGSYEHGGLIGHELGSFALTRDGYQLVGGVPGTTTNSDLPIYNEDAAQDVQDGDGVSDYYERDNKIDETKEQVRVAPSVTDLSVAVTLNANAPGAADVNVAELIHHIAVGANIGGEDPESKVSVLLVPFPVEPAQEPAASGFFTTENMPYLIIAAAALLLLIIVLMVILSIRRKKKRKEEEDQRIIEEQLGELSASGMLSELGIVPPAEEGAQPPPTAGADIMDINTEKSMELRKAVRQFVQNNPEVAALMLRTWIKGGEDDNG